MGMPFAPTFAKPPPTPFATLLPVLTAFDPTLFAVSTALDPTLFAALVVFDSRLGVLVGTFVGFTVFGFGVLPTLGLVVLPPPPPLPNLPGIIAPIPPPPLVSMSPILLVISSSSPIIVSPCADVIPTTLATSFFFTSSFFLS